MPEHDNAHEGNRQLSSAALFGRDRIQIGRILFVGQRPMLSQLPLGPLQLLAEQQDAPEPFFEPLDTHPAAQR